MLDTSYLPASGQHMSKYNLMTLTKQQDDDLNKTQSSELPLSRVNNLFQSSLIADGVLCNLTSEVRIREL